MAFPLLLLPPELRARVIDFVLVQSCNAPSYPSLVGERLLVNDFEERYVKWDEGALYENTWHNIYENSVRLLLVNRQINAETRMQMHRSEKDVSYNLDVVLNSERRLLPTWTCVPQQSNQLQNLNMNFRLFGQEPPPQPACTKKLRQKRRAARNVWQFEHWRTASLFNSISDMLARIVALGASPPGPYYQRSINRKTMIRNLNIDIDRTEHTSSSCPMWEDCPHLWDLKKLVPIDFKLKGEKDPLCVLHPELFLYWLISHVKTTLLTKGSHFRPGVMLYSHFGSINFSLDGTWKETLDLGHALVKFPKQLRVHPSFGHDMDEWVSQMLAERTRRGLTEPGAEYDREFWERLEFDLFEFM